MRVTQQLLLQNEETSEQCRMERKSAKVECSLGCNDCMACDSPDSEAAQPQGSISHCGYQVQVMLFEPCHVRRTMHCLLRLRLTRADEETE